MKPVNNVYAEFSFFVKDAETGYKIEDVSYNARVYFTRQIEKFANLRSQAGAEGKSKNDYSKIAASICLQNKALLKRIEADRRAVTIWINATPFYVIDIKPYAITTSSGAEILLGEGQIQ